MSDTFQEYAPFIQDYIYRNRWNTLRGVQVAAADVIFHSQDHLLLCASTASGKTEAAFFPVLSLLDQEPAQGVEVLYIAPLKALINDQYDRLTDLCQDTGITITKWHGDAPRKQKTELLEHPQGVLQITPESLESLLMNHSGEIRHVFAGLRFVIIDELHSFLRSDRGSQTFCLLERLERLTDVHPRRIGLSATIGNPQFAAELLARGTSRKTQVPTFQAEKDTWLISMEHFYTTTQQEDTKMVNVAVQEELEAKSDRAPKHADPSLAYIFTHTKGHKCLVFTNSREECEEVTQSFRQYCEINGEPDRFMIHHGNLSASFRQSAEEAMKMEDYNLTVCTTATLELGIDIGQLERAFQINAPYTVSSFLQRMGRTGRRGNPSEMWFVIREEEQSVRDMAVESIPFALLQAIALIQLYIEKKWVEPPTNQKYRYSLLYHQTMSTLASKAEMSYAELKQDVLSLSSFSNISEEDYDAFLQYLLSIDHLQESERGRLLVGLAGERVIHSFKFYGVFVESNEFTVLYQSTQLGTIAYPPQVNDKVAIAGKVWIVLEVDRMRKKIYVDAVKGKKAAYFGDCPGDIHTEILKRMHQVLCEERTYPYLMKQGMARLLAARKSAKFMGADQKQLICLGENMWALLPWLGSYSFLALERFLKIRCKEKLGLKNFDSERPYYMEFTMKGNEETFYRVLKEEIQKPLDAMELLYDKEVPIFEKYDRYIPEDLLRKGFAYGVLQVEEMKDWVLGYLADYEAKHSIF